MKVATYKRRKWDVRQNVFIQKAACGAISIRHLTCDLKIMIDADVYKQQSKEVSGNKWAIVMRKAEHPPLVL